MPVQKVSKEQIIKTAHQIFKKQGYHKTSLDTIARACHLFKGSLYHYFDSKENLMKEVLVYNYQHFKEEVLTLAYKEDTSPKKRMAKMFTIMKEQYLDEDGCTMGNIGLETNNTVPELNEVITAFFRDWIEAFTHIYQYQYPAAQAKEIATERIQELEGAIMLCRFFKTTVHIERVVQKILNELS